MHRLELDPIAYLVIVESDKAYRADIFDDSETKGVLGIFEAAAERALGYSGQLAAYANAIRAATGAEVTSTWIHFPARGRLVEVRL